MNKNSAFRLFLLISIFCMPILPVAAEVLTGNCGETLYWSFDTETGHLEITGSGKTELQHPWIRLFFWEMPSKPSQIVPFIIVPT